MAIAVNEKVFTLCTKNSMYQMKADEHGVLLHTYYGKRTEQMDFSYPPAQIIRQEDLSL